MLTMRVSWILGVLFLSLIHLLIVAGNSTVPLAKTTAVKNADVAKPKIQTKTNTKPKPQTKTDAKPQTKTDAKPQTKTDAKNDVDTSVKTIIDFASNILPIPSYLNAIIPGIVSKWVASSSMKHMPSLIHGVAYAVKMIPITYIQSIIKSSKTLIPVLEIIVELVFKMYKTLTGKSDNNNPKL